MHPKWSSPHTMYVCVAKLPTNSHPPIYTCMEKVRVNACQMKWEREREMGMQQSQSELKFFLNVYSRMRGSGAAGLKFSIVFCCFVSNNFYPLFFLSLSHFFTIKSNLSLFWKKVGNLKMMSEALFLCHVSFLFFRQNWKYLLQSKS